MTNSAFDLFSSAYQDAVQDMRNVDADIDEAVTFFEKGQPLTAIGVLNATLHGIERAVKAFPEFEAQAKPALARIESVTLQIIASQDYKQQ